MTEDQIEGMSPERLEEALRSALNENLKLREALQWYVDNDDTNESAYNEPWLEGKRRAQSLLENP